MFAGLLALALAGADVVVEFVVVVELPFAEVLVVLVEFVVEVVFAGAVVVFVVFVVFALLALVAVLFAGVVPPHAKPNAANARTDESAITFFI